MENSNNQQKSCSKNWNSEKINKGDIPTKIKQYFSNKLEILEVKFKSDLKVVKPFKFEYVELYHDLENLLIEITNFIEGKEDQNINNNTPSEKSQPQDINFKQSQLQTESNTPKITENNKNGSAKPLDKKKYIPVNGNLNDNSNYNTVAIAPSNKIHISNNTAKKNVNLILPNDNLNAKKKEVTTNLNAKTVTPTKNKNPNEETLASAASKRGASALNKKEEIGNKDKDKEKVLDKSNFSATNTEKKKSVINPTIDLKNSKNTLSVGANNEKTGNLKTKTKLPTGGVGAGVGNSNANAKVKLTNRTSSMPKNLEKKLENAETAKKTKSVPKKNDNDTNEKIEVINIEYKIEKENENEDEMIVSNFVQEKQEEVKEEINKKEKLEQIIAI